MPGTRGEPLSVAEWIALPTLPMPVIADARERATVYHVVGIAVLPAPAAEVRRIGVTSNAPGGMVPLPTVTVRADQHERLYRLPIELNGWSFDCVALALDGQLHFPCDVEFGVIEGRPYAEFVIEDASASPPSRANDAAKN